MLGSELGGIYMAQSKIKKRMLIIAAAVLLTLGGALTIAYAQSGSSAFNLNSPASFPVDI